MSISTRFFALFVLLTFVSTSLIISCRNNELKPSPKDSSQTVLASSSPKSKQSRLVLDTQSGNFCFSSTLWLKNIAHQTDSSHFLAPLLPIDEGEIVHDYVEISYKALKDILAQGKSLKFHTYAKPNHKYFRLSLSIVIDETHSHLEKYLSQYKDQIESNQDIESYEMNKEDDDLYLFKSQIVVIEEGIKNLEIKDEDYIVFNPISFIFTNEKVTDYYKTYTISYWKLNPKTGYKKQIPAGVALNPSPPFKKAISLYLK